jgi:hypothetical protein
MRHPYQVDTQIGKVLDYLHRIIGASIIDDDELEISEALIKDTDQRGFQIARAIIDTHKHTDAGLSLCLRYH